MATKPNIKIQDFTDTEIWTVQQTLDERWGKGKIEIQMADVEVRFRPEDRELSQVPAIFWEHDRASFVIIKVGRSTYKTQFFYKGREQYSTTITTFDNIHDCIITVIQVHADLESKKNQSKENN